MSAFTLTAYIAWAILMPQNHSYGWYWFKMANGRFDTLQQCQDTTATLMNVQCLPEGETPRQLPLREGGTE